MTETQSSSPGEASGSASLLEEAFRELVDIIYRSDYGAGLRLTERVKALNDAGRTDLAVLLTPR